MDVEKLLKHMASGNSEYMRKIFRLVLCTLFILPSQSYSAGAFANDSCLSLDAQQYLEANSRLIPVGSNFTVEFDFYLQRDEKDYAEIISQGGQPYPFYVGIDPDLGIRAGDAWIDTGAKMPLKKWVHIALTHTSREVGTLYIDGKVFATINNYKLNNAGIATRVGAQYEAGGPERINGCIDNLMIWKSVRTPNQVAQDSLVKSPITDADLIAFYGFDSVSSTGLIEDNAVPSNSLRPLSTPKLIRIENVQEAAGVIDEQEAAGVIDEQYSIYRPNDSNKVGVFFEENVDTLRMPSLLYSYVPATGHAISYCAGLDDPKCSSAELMRYYALMPACKSVNEVDCIESIYAVAPGSPARIKGIYKESIPEKVVNPYIADPNNGLPQGSVSGVWEIPNVRHGGGSTDFVGIVSRVGTLKRNGTNWDVQGRDFRAAIYPVNVIRDSRYKANVSEIIKQPDGATWMGINHPSELPFDVCAIVGDGVCAMRQSFPENIEFGMVIRFSKVINGWMHGRIDSPEIDYELTSYGTRVDMKGQSTRVPILAGFVALSDFSKNLSQNPDLDTGNGSLTYRGASGDYTMEQLILWSKLLKDKAVANPTQWIFYNLPEQDMEAASSCIKDSKTLAGFVTTNSTTYTASPPIYNEQTGTLDYKVASPHFLADGKVFQGKYNLYIDSKVARCIYNFSSAPISATVSITSADGGQQSVATTVVSEQSGWLHLSAVGFTFSTPTLKVKLTQDPNAVVVQTPAPTPTPTAESKAPEVTPTAESKAPAVKPATTATVQAVKPIAASKKKVTITCVKGKVIKKVAAVSPKCPAGYKKKA